MTLLTVEGISNRGLSAEVIVTLIKKEKGKYSIFFSFPLLKHTVSHRWLTSGRMC